MSEILFEMKKINKYYKKFHALKDISFQVKKGEILGFLGPNGSGKTTTIKIIAGLITDYYGDIFYKKQKVKSIGDFKEVKFIFDFQRFYENLSAFDNLKIVAQLNGKYDRKFLLKIIEKVGLGGWEKKPVKTFSLGMKQRLALAIAELEVPEFLIMDEPTNGLDIEGISSFEDYVKRLNKDYGTTIILSSHYLEEVERLSDHIIIINKGKKIFDSDFKRLKELRRTGIKYVLIDSVVSDNFIKNLKNFIIAKLNINLIKIDYYLNNLYINANNISDQNIEKINEFLLSNSIRFTFIEPIEKSLADIVNEEIKR